ncbi:hypothetical protein [Sulfobacillus harzensis]|uniref:Uncharacterized protein n=1 Tax=Sulfobacillus harzensis TaxID=2729629 RepID=A0A7Y0Q252_9FIRM|nr:hypothetical protein [Sulfobacillus harzensis]NMP22818.1 hypothetical protein [Sulfobacillus harzensis]
MSVAEKTKLPVATVEVQGFDGDPQITAVNLPMWFGDPAGTVSTANALLNGWTVRGDAAIRGTSMLRLVSSPTSDTLYIEEPAPTAAQLKALKPLGWPVPSASSAVTVEIQTRPTASGSGLAAGIGAVVHALASKGPMATTLFFVTVPAPAPRNYESYAGGINPAEWLTPPEGGGQYICSSGKSSVMGLSAGLVTPLPVSSISNANGITEGFAMGAFLVSSDHAGIIQNYWYSIPGITAPR